MDSCGSGLAWLLGTHSGTCRMPPLPLPHLNKYLLSTCCVSVRDQRSEVSSPSLGLTQLGHWGLFAPKRTVCTGPGPIHLECPVPLGQLAGAAGREPAGCCAWNLAAVSLGAREVPHLLLGVSAQFGAVPAL